MDCKIFLIKNLISLREETHKKSFFSGRTTKGVGRLTPNPPPATTQNHFFLYKSVFFSPKIGEKKIGKIRFRLN